MAAPCEWLRVSDLLCFPRSASLSYRAERRATSGVRHNIAIYHHRANEVVWRDAMPRDLPLANGRMLVNFDFEYNVRDVYWPHVGERNQTLGHVNHFGVWVDGAFV